MAYAMYLRKSRIDEEAGLENTLSKHETMLRDMAARMGIHIDETHIYREIVSGESIDARPQMQRLLKAVEMGLYTGVLCVELERLSRGNGEDQARILRTFQFSGTKIITLSKVYDLAGDDEFDEEFFEFGLFMSRREYKTIKRRLLRGRLQAQKDGYFIGSTPPYGYGKRKDGKGWTLCPDPSESQIVRLIFNRYAEGARINDILRELQASGVRQRTGNEFTRTRIGEILRNRSATKSTKLEIVERMVVDAIQAELERLTYVWAGYETKANDNTNELQVLEAEIDKRQKMLERACEAYETGIYDRTTYLQRVQKVNAEKAELLARLETLKDSEPERDIKRIPILSKALDEYWTLDSEDRNRLLKGMAERIEYEKTERGTGLNPRLHITLRI